MDAESLMEDARSLVDSFNGVVLRFNLGCQNAGIDEPLSAGRDRFGVLMGTFQLADVADVIKLVHGCMNELRETRARIEELEIVQESHRTVMAALKGV